MTGQAGQRDPLNNGRVLGRSVTPGSAQQDRGTRELSAWTVEPGSSTNEIPGGFSPVLTSPHHNWYYHAWA